MRRKVKTILLSWQKGVFDDTQEPNVLTGKIDCADCGAPMYNHRQRKRRERICYTAKGEKRISHSNPTACYECSTYHLASPENL